MEPELYDYENSQQEDYSQDEWYYQNKLDHYGDEEAYDTEEEPDWFGEQEDENYYEPHKEV